MNKASITRLFLFFILTGILVQGGCALAPADAPALVNPPPSGETERFLQSTPAASAMAVPALPTFPLWMTALGVLLIAGAAGGFILLRRPREYVPRSRRLQK